MNSIAAIEPPKSLVPKRVVSNVLLAMLAITALTSLTDFFPSASGLLLFLWPMSMLVLGSYWLRLVLSEQDYLEDTAVSLHQVPFYRGLNLAPTLQLRG